MHDQRGFSILELCTVILILGILMHLSVPTFTQFLMREERTIVLDRLKTAIEYAKQEAFIRGKTMTLCGTLNYKTCQVDDWSAGFMIAEMDEEFPHFAAKILYVFPKLHYGLLHFDQFGTYLNITANGTTINNGTFTYCPKSGDRKEADGLIINNASRSYRPIKRNSQGILLKNTDTAEEKPLRCR